MDQIHAMLNVIEELLPELKERLHPTSVQKIADAHSDLGQLLLAPQPIELPEAGTFGASSEPYTPTLPPVVQDLLDRAMAELDRRAKSEEASLAMATRLAEATERQAAATEKMTEQYAEFVTAAAAFNAGKS